MKLKTWTVGQKLFSLVVVSAGLLVALQALNVYSAYKLTDSMKKNSHLSAVRAMTLADMMHDGLRAVVFRSIVALQRADKAEFDDALKEYADFSKNIVNYLTEVRQAQISPQVVKDSDAALEEVKNYVQAGQTILDMVEKQNMTGALGQIAAYQKAFKDLEEKLEKLGDEVEKTVQSGMDQTQAMGQRTQFWAMGLTVVGVILNLAFGFMINRSLVSSLRAAVEGLSQQGEAIKRHSDQIDNSSSRLSEASTQQASAVQETAAAIEEINAMVSKASSNAKRLADSSQSSFEVVEDGRNAIQRMLGEMDGIKESNGSVMRQIEQSNNDIKNIVRVIGEIGEKTRVINDIVFQTKLLSFNASVEAARAGEHGKGFAVVADEIGSLAQMSGNAAKEIGEMLEAGMSQVTQIVDGNRARISDMMEQNLRKIDAGSQVAGQCGEAFSKIIDRVGEVSQLSGEISAAIEEQRMGLGEIGKAIGLFNESSQQNSRIAQNAASVSHELQASFQELSQLMFTLQNMVNGRHEQSVAYSSAEVVSDEIQSTAAA